VICPACGETFEPTIVAGLTVHPSPCGASIAMATGQRASEAEIRGLSTADMAALRALRARPARAKP